MWVLGHPRCTWDIQTYIEAFEGVHYSKKCTWYTQDVRGTPKMYVGHPRCTWDIQTNIEAFQGVHYSQKCTWYTQDVRGTFKLI